MKKVLPKQKRKIFYLIATVYFLVMFWIAGLICGMSHPFQYLSLYWNGDTAYAKYEGTYTDVVEDDHGRGGEVTFYVYKFRVHGKSYRIDTTTESDSMPVLYLPNRPSCHLELDIDDRSVAEMIAVKQVLFLLITAIIAYVIWLGISQVLIKKLSPPDV